MFARRSFNNTSFQRCVDVRQWYTSLVYQPYATLAFFRPFYFPDFIETIPPMCRRFSTDSNGLVGPPKAVMGSGKKRRIEAISCRTIHSTLVLYVSTCKVAVGTYAVSSSSSCTRIIKPFNETIAAECNEPVDSASIKTLQLVGGDPGGDEAPCVPPRGASRRRWRLSYLPATFSPPICRNICAQGRSRHFGDGYRCVILRLPVSWGSATLLPDE
ncbi:hypothetical protein WA026_011651, partial [Henosepilachna vigintioctopunctata]